MRKILQNIIEFIRSILFPPVVYTCCDDLPKWNFDKITETKDFKYLISGSQFGRKTEAPENGAEIWDKILEEYSEKTENDKAVLYFEMLADLSDLETRVYFAEVIIKKLAKHVWIMEEETRKEYIQILKSRGFYFNESKPVRAEIDRLLRQVKAANTKIEAKQKELEEFEKKHFSGDINTAQLKIKIQRALKVQIDLKTTTVTEWLAWINETTQTKAA